MILLVHGGSINILYILFCPVVISLYSHCIPSISQQESTNPCDTFGYQGSVRDMRCVWILRSRRASWWLQRNRKRQPGWPGYQLRNGQVTDMLTLLVIVRNCWGPKDQISWQMFSFWVYGHRWAGPNSMVWWFPMCFSFHLQLSNWTILEDLRAETANRLEPRKQSDS